MMELEKESVLVKNKVFDQLEEQGICVEMLEEEKALFFEEPSYLTAIVGVTSTNRVVYDYEKMIEWLVNKDGMDTDEAIDFIDYNNSFHVDDMEPLILYPATVKELEEE